MKKDTKLYQFQEEGVDFLEWKKGRALLGDDMGLGKTIQILTWIKYRMKRGKLDKSLIVCPAGLKYHWERQALQHCGLRSTIVNGRRPYFHKIEHAKVVIANYDILMNWLEAFLRWNPDLIAFDECHAISSARAKRTKAAMALGKERRYIIGASGTPMTNRPIDLYNILHLVRPDVFNNRWAYALRYCGPYHNGWSWVYNGSSNEEELHRLLNNTCMIRRRKEDVLEDLPEKRRNVVIVDIDNREEYKRAENEFIKWLADQGDMEKVKRALRNQAVVQMTYLKKLVGMGKVKAVKEWLDLFLESTNEKINVFGLHIEDFLDKLRDHYGNRCVKVDGSVTKKKREAVIQEYLSDPNKSLFLGQLAATHAGWSAPGVRNTLMGEFWWTPGLHLQAEERTRGIGRGVKGLSSDSYWLVAKDTIEERLIEILFLKQETIGKIMDGDDAKDQMDTFNQLLNYYWEKRKNRRKKGVVLTS